MLPYYVISNSGGGNSIEINHGKKKTRDIFYSPLKKIHAEMKILYLYTTKDDPKCAEDLGWKVVSDKGKQVIGSVYAFNKYIEPFNTTKFYVYNKGDSSNIYISRNQLNISPKCIFWAFTNPSKIRLYPLSVVLWPPIYDKFPEILRLLSNYYRVVNVTNFRLGKSKVVRFVKRVYQDDKRCDKSQLPGKCKHLVIYPLNIRYIRILVDNPQINKDGISQTAIEIKEVIRGLFKRFVKNYVHDIVCHISDNAKHSKSMERSVLQELNHLNY